MAIWNKYKTSPIITIILITCNILAFNWLSYAIYVRWDVSSVGRFRLASTTKQILKKLPEQVTLEIFISQEVPDNLIQQIQNVKNFLIEYANASSGKVNIVHYTPDTNESDKERAIEIGVPQSQVQIQGESKLDLRQIYLAISISYEGKNEIINEIINTPLLEYQLTSKIYQMAYPGERQIGFLNTNTHFTLDKEAPIPFYSLNILNERLKPFYGNVTSVDITNNEIPAEITTLLIVSPNSLTEMEKFRIDQFILKGGNLILGLAGFNIDFRSGRLTTINEETIKFFNHYGIHVTNKIILEPKNYLPFQLVIPYPAWMVANTISEGNNNLIDSMVSNTEGVFLPWTSNLTIDTSKFYTEIKKDKKNDKSSKKVDNYIIVKSSEDSFNMDIQRITIDPRMLNKMIDPKSPGSNDRKPRSYNLVAFVKEKFYSYFKDNPIPKEASKKDYLTVSEKPAQILATSTPFFFSNIAFQMGERVNLSNSNLLLSSLDAMHGLEELISLRKKDVSSPLLRPIKPWTKNIFIILNFLIPLICLGIFATVRLISRKKLGNLPYSIT